MAKDKKMVSKSVVKKFSDIFENDLGDHIDILSAYPEFLHCFEINIWHDIASGGLTVEEQAASPLYYTIRNRTDEGIGDVFPYIISVTADTLEKAVTRALRFDFDEIRFDHYRSKPIKRSTYLKKRKSVIESFLKQFKKDK